MANFRGLVIWITGASAGIGRALAVAFATEGARVAVSARRAERLQDVVERIEAEGGEGLSVPCDVADEMQVRNAVDTVVRHWGRLDVTVANAGFGVTGHFEELSAEDWRRQFDVNVVGLAMTARYALPHLRRTSGRLVLVGSVAGMIPAPGAAPYGASKAAVRSIGQSLAVDLHGSGVTCTTIHPGFVESDIARVDNAGVYDSERRDRRPAPLMWPADRAARVMVKAIDRRKREYVFTAHGKIGGLIGRHWPALAHFAVSRGSSWRQRNKEGKPDGWIDP